MENQFRPSGKEYLYVNDECALKIDKKYIARLKKLAHENEENKCTMCLHNDTREKVHEMINVYPQLTYVRPHSHPLKTETKIMIEGKMLVLLFDGEGNIIDRFVMERQGIFTFRLGKGIIHTNIPLTDVVFHEVTEGPFRGKGDSVFPEWAPLQDDKENVERFMIRIGMNYK